MNTKMILGGIVGGVVSFLLGWVVFGILLEPYYTSNMVEYSGSGLVRAEADMHLWAIAVAQFAWSFLLAWIFSKWGGINAMKGFVNGFIIFLLVTTGFDLFMYAQFNLYKGTFYLVDIAVNAVFGGIVGAVIGMVMGMPMKKATTL
ncbi:MAG: hypothetical protein SH856_05890 [Flavobacteriales bacterium]|nr:hypothetical protein [Flavobacteriales bacterium]